MNQTRVFLIFAWLMVATLLWLEWNKDKAAPAATAVAAQTATTPGSTVPAAVVPASPSSGTVPSAPTVAPMPTASAKNAATARVTKAAPKK